MSSLKREPVHAALTIDAQLVERLIAVQFPQWACLPIHPVRHMGWDNRTFHLGTDMAVRLPSAAVYARQVPKEHRWLPILRPKLPLPIPIPVALGQPGEGYPWQWSIYQWLPGEPLSALRLSDTRRLAQSLASFLKALQRIDPSGGPRPSADNFHRGGRLRTYDSQTREAIPLMRTRIDAEAATRVWEAALATQHDGAPTWLHGDISSGNLLIENGELAGVIDFGCLAVGDPACDLAIAWTWMDRRGRAAFRSALPFDEGMWARGRGWALWKLLLACAGLAGGHAGSESQSFTALEEVLRGDG